MTFSSFPYDAAQGKGQRGSADRQSPGRQLGMPSLVDAHGGYGGGHGHGAYPNGLASRVGPGGYPAGYPNGYPGSAGSSPARNPGSMTGGGHPHHHSGALSPGSVERGLSAEARAREREKLLGGAASNPMGFPLSFPPVYAAGHAGVPPRDHHGGAQGGALGVFGQPSSPGGGAVVAGGVRGVSVAQGRRAPLGKDKEGDAACAIRSRVTPLARRPQPAALALLFPSALKAKHKEKKAHRARVISRSLLR